MVSTSGQRHRSHRKVQRAATQLVPELRKLNYNERLKRLDLTTLQRRRIRGDLIETYKTFSGKERISSVQFFKLSTNEHGLRAHNLKIFKHRSRLDVRKFFFSNRVVNDWNSLPPIMLNYLYLFGYVQSSSMLSHAHFFPMIVQSIFKTH